MADWDEPDNSWCPGCDSWSRASEKLVKQLADQRQMLLRAEKAIRNCVEFPCASCGNGTGDHLEGRDDGCYLGELLRALRARLGMR